MDDLLRWRTHVGCDNVSGCTRQVCARLAMRKTCNAPPGAKENAAIAVAMA